MSTLGEYNGAGSGVTKLLLHLNGNSTDSSGNANNGTNTNITFSQANGRFGQGAGFNVNSYITLDASKLPTGSSAFTTGAWVSFTSFNGSNNSQMIIEWGSRGAGTGSSWQFQFNQTTLNPAFYNITTPEVALVVPNDGTWHFICSTYSGGTNGTVNQYYDGKLVATGAISGTPNITTTTAKVGMYVDQTATYGYKGKIDELIIENVAWSAEKVKKYYTTSKGRFATL